MIADHLLGHAGPQALPGACVVLILEDEQVDIEVGRALYDHARDVMLCRTHHFAMGIDAGGREIVYHRLDDSPVQRLDIVVGGTDAQARAGHDAAGHDVAMLDVEDMHGAPRHVYEAFDPLKCVPMVIGLRGIEGNQNPPVHRIGVRFSGMRRLYDRRPEFKCTLSGWHQQRKDAAQYRQAGQDIKYARRFQVRSATS